MRSVAGGLITLGFILMGLAAWRMPRRTWPVVWPLVIFLVLAVLALIWIGVLLP